MNTKTKKQHFEVKPTEIFPRHEGTFGRTENAATQREREREREEECNRDRVRHTDTTYLPR